jgi:hypothetical protein
VRRELKSLVFEIANQAFVFLKTVLVEELVANRVAVRSGSHWFFGEKGGVI